MKSSAKSILKLCLVVAIVIVVIALSLFVIRVFDYFWEGLTDTPPPLELGVWQVCGILELNEVVSSAGFSFNAEMVVHGAGDDVPKDHRRLSWDVFIDKQRMGEGDEASFVERLIDQYSGTMVCLRGIIFSPCGKNTYLRPKGSDPAAPCLGFTSKGYVHLVGPEGEPFWPAREG